MKTSPRTGRPRCEVSIVDILRLRAEGKTVREMMSIPGATRGTINNRLREFSNGPHSSSLCVGRVGDPRTALAIKRFKLGERRWYWDEWQAIVNQLWIEGKALGCPWCGLVRRLGTPKGLCSRHYRMNAAVQRIEDTIINQLPRLFYRATVVRNRAVRDQRRRRRLTREAVRAATLSGKPAERLLQLLRITNGSNAD